MKRNLLLLSLSLGLLSTIVIAQPQPDGAPIATNPPNAGAPQTPEQRDKQMQEIMKKAQEEGLAIMKLPPDQMRARLRQIQSEALRQEMDRLGFKEKQLQDRIIKFIDEQEKSREEVRTQGAKVLTAMTTPGGATTDEGLIALLEDYLGAVDEAKAKRASASATLDNEIGWNRNARLRAFLTLKGFVGEESWMLEDLMMAGTMTIGSVMQSQVGQPRQ